MFSDFYANYYLKLNIKIILKGNMYQEYYIVKMMMF